MNQHTDDTITAEADATSASAPTWADARELPSPFDAPAAPLLDVDNAPESQEADPFPGEDARPCFGVYDQWIERHGKKYRPGVYQHGLTKETKTEPPQPVESWVCGPLHIDASTANTEDADHGRLLRYRNASGWGSQLIVVL